MTAYFDLLIKTSNILGYKKSRVTSFRCIQVSDNFSDNASGYVIADNQTTDMPTLVPANGLTTQSRIVNEVELDSNKAVENFLSGFKGNLYTTEHGIQALHALYGTSFKARSISSLYERTMIKLSIPNRIGADTGIGIPHLVEFAANKEVGMRIVKTMPNNNVLCKILSHTNSAYLGTMVVAQKGMLATIGRKTIDVSTFIKRFESVVWLNDLLHETHTPEKQ